MENERIEKIQEAYQQLVMEFLEDKIPMVCSWYHDYLIKHDISRKVNGYYIQPVLGPDFWTFEDIIKNLIRDMSNKINDLCQHVEQLNNEKKSEDI